jgi:prephenate dehydratase
MKRLSFATQGDKFSYHALAAEIAAGEPVDVIPCDTFAQVVGKSRANEPGLGVVAVNNTLSGVVTNSATQLVRYRPSELPPIVARVDLSVSLSLAGTSEQDLETLNREEVICLGQRPALDQCIDFMTQFLPKVKLIESEESTKAIRDMLDADSSSILAIGPAFAVTGLGATILHNQINPAGHRTSFYVLQRDPRLQLLPESPACNYPVSVTSVGFPDQDGEKEKVLDIASDIGLPMVRVIDFAQGDFTRDADLRKRGGGLFDVAGDLYDEKMYEFRKRVNQLKTNDGRTGPFTAKVLGSYSWQIA